MYKRQLLGVLAVWAARRFWARRRWRDAAAYVAATTAGLYTLYQFAPVWGAINVAWVIGLWGSRAKVRGASESATHRALPWVSLQLLVLALFLPWVIYAAGGFLSTASATPIRLLDFLHIYWTVLTLSLIHISEPTRPY